MKLKKSFYFKLLTFITILTTVPVLVVGLFSYLKSSAVIESNIAKEKEQSVYQIQTNIEQALKTVDLSVTNFVTSYHLIHTLGEELSPEQFHLYNQTKKEINQLQRFDVGISDFLLISLDKEWRMNNNGLRRLEHHQKEQIKEHYMSTPAKSYWLVEKKEDLLFDVNSGLNCPYYISLVKQLPLGSTEISGLSIAYIPICHFKEMLQNNNDSETIMILDENQHIIAHSQFNEIGNAYTNESFFAKVESNKKNAGQFNLKEKESDYNVTYRKSDFNDWTYVSKVRLRDLYEQSHSIRSFTFLISSAILLFILIIAALYSKKLYKPINKIGTVLSSVINTNQTSSKDELGRIEQQIRFVLEENEQLETKLQGQIDQLKQLMTMRLIQGEMTPEELKEKIVSYEYNQIWKRATVIAIQIDNLEYSKYHNEDEDLLLLTINTIIKETIPSNQRLTPVVMNQTQVTILLGNQVSLAETIDDVKDKLNQINNRIKAELDLSVSIGVSNTFTDLLDAESAYKESIDALRYTLKYGPGSVIFFKDVQIDTSFYTFYPRQLEKNLFSAIESGDKEKTDRYLEELINELFDNQSSHTQYEVAIIRLLTNLIDLTETLGIDVFELKKHHSLIEQLYQFRALPEVVNWFKEVIVYPLMNKVQERTESQYKNISDQIIHIVQQEFDSDISLNYIAQKLHYNPNYLSSIFKKETNTSFSEYLSLYRLTKAKEWLVETDMTVKEIAEKLQYNNSQNFIRTFKKAEGITPGKYRKNYLS